MLLFSVYALALVLISNAEGAEFKNSQIFGPFKVVDVNLTNCEKTMKPQPYSKAILMKHVKDDGSMYFNITLEITHDVGPIMGKIRIERLVDGKYTKVLSLNQNNLCKYAFPLKFLPIKLKMDFAKCILQPAVYDNIIIDINTVTYGLLGESFFYGKFKAQLEWFSPKHMIACINVQSEHGPK